MPVDRDKLLTEGQALLQAGQSVEDILSSFRSQGANKIDCIVLMTRLTNISLGEAKRVVHLSATWSDFKEPDEEFHEQLWKAIKQSDIPGLEWSEEPIADDPSSSERSGPAAADTTHARESWLRSIKCRLSQFLVRARHEAAKRRENRRKG